MKSGKHDKPDTPGRDEPSGNGDSSRRSDKPAKPTTPEPPGQAKAEPPGQASDKAADHPADQGQDASRGRSDPPGPSEQHGRTAAAPDSGRPSSDDPEQGNSPNASETAREPREPRTLPFAASDASISPEVATAMPAEIGSVSPLDVQPAASAPLPSLRIVADQSFSEGNTGTRQMSVLVYLTPASSNAVTFRYTTADVSAQAGSDYVAETALITIPAGNTSWSFDIAIKGDTTVEPDERLDILVEDLVGAIYDNASHPEGRILNDDGPPTLILADTTSRRETSDQPGRVRGRPEPRQPLSGHVQLHHGGRYGHRRVRLRGREWHWHHRRKVRPEASRSRSR